MGFTHSTHNRQFKFFVGRNEHSEVIEEITSGNMPPDGPPLTPDQIQLFVDWIKQQPLQEGDHHGHDDDHDDMDDDRDDYHDDDHDDHDDDDNGDE